MTGSASRLVHAGRGLRGVQPSSKADKDVAERLPPAADYRCTYLTDWTVVKTRWGLSVDQAEADALHRLAADCPNEPLSLTLAR